MLRVESARGRVLGTVCACWVALSGCGVTGQAPTAPPAERPAVSAGGLASTGASGEDDDRVGPGRRGENRVRSAPHDGIGASAVAVAPRPAVTAPPSSGALGIGNLYALQAGESGGATPAIPVHPTLEAAAPVGPNPARLDPGAAGLELGAARLELGVAGLELGAARLDPNARYTTTYRPGGAALAAFDAAVSRGEVPAVYRDLVGDFGARYALACPAPAQGALSVTVQTERAAAPPDGGPMNLAVTLAASDATPARAPLDVHLVLDTSGSMSGRAIDDAKAAAVAVVGELDDRDHFSMITFSNTASVLVPDGAVGPRRAWVFGRIEGVKADGGTNISAGLDLAYRQAKTAGLPDDAVRLVMLLSDGHANDGDTDPVRLADRAARAFQGGVQTSAFGLGTDFDAALMSRIADRGAGGYYYLADSSQIAPALATEIDARMRPVATAVELRVRLRPEVSATHVFGSRELSSLEAAAVRTQELAIDAREGRRGIAPDRAVDAEGGMRFFIPAFARADRNTTMLTLSLPPGTGERNIASVEVRYKDRLANRNVTKEIAVRMRRVASDAESAATVDRSIEPLAQAFAAGETILNAAERVDALDRDGARRLLDERAEVLRRAAEALGDPRLDQDGARLARLAGVVGGHEPLTDPRPLVVLLRGSGYGYL